MESLEPKKLALVRILQILQKYSDYDHPLKQEEIARHLDETTASSSSGRPSAAIFRC